MDIEQINTIQLSNLLKECEVDILEGNVKLSLTASLLQKINYALQELEYDHVSFSNSSVPEGPIKFLQDLIHKTPKLAVTQRIKRETWRVDISRFTNLKYLELSKIPMHLVEGMQSLRSQLEVLICERCTDCLEEILGTSDHIWEELRTAKLCYNDFALLCPFTNTPWLQYLDLSYNKIEDRLCLQTLKNLKYLNLSFNFLTSVPMLSEEVCHKLKVLLINNNYVQDLAAISVFDSLEVLDVSNNLLADHSAISPILFLPHLCSIRLTNNPISYHPHHRFHTCSYLNKGVIPNEFLLDGRPLNLLEQKEIGRRGETYRHLGISLPRDLTCLPSGSMSQSTSRSGSKKKVRNAVIEEGMSNVKPKISIKPPEINQDHLETKKQVEEIRQRYGEAHWLHSHAGSYVQDLMGLQKSSGNEGNIFTSSPFTQDMFPPSPKRVSVLDKQEAGSSTRFDSSASEDYVTAMTTQAIIERIPRHAVTTSTSEGSDQELKEPLLVKTEPETQEPTKPPETEPVGETSPEESFSEEREQEEEEELEDIDEGELWLVQQQIEGSGLVAIFLTLNEKEICEKCTNTSRTTTKWSLESVESCEKINSNPPTVHITFNTIRKTCRQRTYVMEFADAQELLKKIQSILEARSLSAMNQVAYRCMKCSSMFSQELQPTVLPTLSALEDGTTENKPVTKCPACGSTLVVEMEEAPLPSTERGTEAVPPTISDSTTPLKHSPSDCSIGSAASLEQRLEVEPQSGTTKEGTPNPRRYDSDIEVISNPSQSSIEVLEVQARLQGNVTPNRKRSNEERLTVAVPQLNTVPEVQTNLVGLTESSSSGSLTDSVCTAYETNPVPVRRVGMSDVPEETTPTSTSTFTSLLEGLIQSVSSKLTPRNSPSTESALTNKVRYSFLDFSNVDHRIKFYLFQNTFNDDNEELSFLLRGHIVTQTGEAVSGCLVVSTHSIYILHVVAPELGDDASEWFQPKGCHRLSEMSAVFALPWQQGAGFRVGLTVYLVLFNNSAYTSNFFIFLNNILEQDGSTLQNITVESEPSTKPERKLEQFVTKSVSASDGPVDPTVRHLTLLKSVSTRKDKEEVLKLSMSPLLITTTDLLLLQPNFCWLTNATEILPQSAAQQKLANIIDISLTGLQLNLHYLNETENQEETWSLGLSSMEAVNLIVESIRGPWEQLFSVPLQLADKH